MKMKKSILSLMLAILMSISTTVTVFADSQSIIKGTKENELKTFKPTLKTVDGQEVKIPDINEFKGFNSKTRNKIQGFSATENQSVKELADFKASVLRDYYGCTSVQYALIDNGEIVLEGSSGVYSYEGNEAVKPNNMYGIASISKMFTTTAIMQLVEKGLIDLDKPVTKYVSDFKMADERYKDITVRMLLNHSSGLMGSSFNNALLYNDNDTFAHDTLLKQLSTQRLKTDPGTYSVYCNDGFTLAEIVVERVTGNSFTSYLTNNIFNPLKLKNTKTPVSYEFDRDKLVKAYSDGSKSALPVENFNTIGTGGLYSSAQDLCNFATTFTNNSNGILSKDSLKAMENKEYLNGVWPEWKEDTLGFGLGWDSVDLYPFNKYNIKALTKSGDSQCYHSSLIVLPEKNMAMAVVTSGSSYTYSIYPQLMASDVLLEALKEKGEIEEILPESDNSLIEKGNMPENIKECEGDYLSSDGMFNIKFQDNTMRLSYTGYPEAGYQEYFYTKDGTFKNSFSPAEYKFVRESNGQTYMQEIYYAEAPLLGKTVSNSYIAQKEEINKVSEDIQKIWKARQGKLYYLMNEKKSSYLYDGLCPSMVFHISDTLSGYCMANRIINENTAVSALDGPGGMARDLYDINFYNEGKIEYGTFMGLVFADENILEAIPNESKFTTTIKENGYANWYKIGDDVANKEITVDIPENAGFAVYNNEGIQLINSWITGGNSIVLPKDGTLVFLGDPYDTFTIRCK